MRNPRDMRTIQIEVTNACVRSCSNCTRFCGHHKKPFYMEFETFKKAVDSLKGFDGIIGIMGGEPTLHPDFKQMTEYLRDNHHMNVVLFSDKQPVSDFPKYVATKQQAGLAINKDGGPGLWTSMTKQYYKHYELIQETFSFQNLNDHSKVSFHQPILITRKEFGISDSEWIEMRNDCWIQNYWSASITPKGVFFCEVAAALDILFDGPGGFPIEQGWWKKDITEFESQFHWCELCGVALKTFDDFKRDANEGIDDISPFLLDKLKQIESKKVTSGEYSVFTATINDIDLEGENKYGSARYVDDYSDRFGDSMSNIRPRNLEIITANNGRDIFKAIGNLKHKDWVLVKDSDKRKVFITETQIQELYLNPGVCFVNNDDGEQILFNINARAVKKAGYEGFYNSEKLSDIKRLWACENIVYFDINIDTECFDKDIERFTEIAEAEIINDFSYRNLIAEQLNEKGIKKGDKVVLLLPCSFYFGRGTSKLLNNLGIETHLFIYEENVCRYENLDKTSVHVFKNNATYDFEKLKHECDELIKNGKFDGAIILVNLPYPELKAKDVYDEVLKIAEYISTKYISCFNIRRKCAKFHTK